MSVPIIPAGKKHDALRLTLAAAQTFLRGALVVLDGSKNVTECGADPASIYGVALEPAGKDPEGNFCIVQKASEDNKFWGSCTSAPTKASNENHTYGVVKQSDGTWVVDLTETVNTRVYIHQVDEDTDRVLFSVIEANRQISA